MKKSSLGRPLKRYKADGDDDEGTEHHALLSTFVLVTTQSRSFSNHCKSYRLLGIEEIASRRTRHLIIQRQLRCSKAEVNSNSVQVHSRQVIRTNPYIPIYSKRHVSVCPWPSSCGDMVGAETVLKPFTSPLLL